jgi:hypothetical protein
MSCSRSLALGDETDISCSFSGESQYVIEVTTKISELKRTDNNVIEFPAKRAKAMISSEADKTGY